MRTLNIEANASPFGTIIRIHAFCVSAKARPQGKRSISMSNHQSLLYCCIHLHEITLAISHTVLHKYKYLLDKISASFSVATVVAAISFDGFSVASLYLVTVANHIQSVVKDAVGA